MILEPESELDKAETELWRKAKAGEIDEDGLSDAWREMEKNTPVSEGEITKENSFMLKRRDAFRRVAENGSGRLR